MPFSSEVEMQNSSPASDINCVVNEARRIFHFTDDPFLDPVERRNAFINEICRLEQTLNHYKLRKKIQIQEKQVTRQKLKELARFDNLALTVRRTKQKLMHIAQERRRRTLSIPTKRRLTNDNQDKLCQAVQGMQLESQNSVNKYLAKVDSPSEIVQDLSKLCMKD